MSRDDVHGSEMDAPDEFDDAIAEKFLAGGGRGIDPRLSDALHAMRTAYTSPPAVGAELSALMSSPTAVSNQPASSRRYARMRSSIIAKIGVAAAAVVAATGGLAAANALPAPIQHAASHLGIASGHHDSAPTALVPDETTTTTDVSPTSTTEPADNHGGEVSAVAHDGSPGCEHGSTVSNVASDGQSESDAADAPDTADPSAHDAGGDECPTPTTVGTVSPNTGEHNGDQTDGETPHPGDGTSGDQHHGDGNGDGNGDVTTTTAAASHDGSGDQHTSDGTDTSGGGTDSHDGGSSDGSGGSSSGN
jgi:hypothetical protein